MRKDRNWEKNSTSCQGTWMQSVKCSKIQWEMCFSLYGEEFHEELKTYLRFHVNLILMCFYCAIITEVVMKSLFTKLYCRLSWSSLVMAFAHIWTVQRRVLTFNDTIWSNCSIAPGCIRYTYQSNPIREFVWKKLLEY